MSDPLYDSRNPNHGRIGGLREPTQDRGAWVTLEQYTREIEESERLRSQLVTVKQHVGWLKQFHLGTTEDNWRDMKLRAERQLIELSTLLTDDFRGKDE